MKSHLKPISKSILLIAGTARDVQHDIQPEIEQLLFATREFKDVYFYIIESDSKDETIRELESLRKSTKNFSYMCLGELSGIIPSRTERIAYCRNMIIEAVINDPKYSEIDFIMMADLDGLNSLLTPKTISQSWSVQENWDAIFANQLDYYYDIYALRHLYWNNVDCNIHEQELNKIFGASISHRLAIKSRQICINKKLGLIEVESAFGGLGIYKRAAFISGRYCGSDGSHDLCEHVLFHRDLREKGYKLYINSALINCDRPKLLIKAKKKRIFLALIQFLGRRILGSERFNKYLDIIKDA